MTSYLIGNLVGRLLASYSLVWLFNLLRARGKWRDAFRYSHRVGSVIVVLLLFVVGVAASGTGA